MEQDKQLKNTAPAVMTDKGPYNTPRAKSKDGKYTANPNASAEAQEAYTDPFPRLRTPAIKFDNFDAKFERYIAQPLFAEAQKKGLFWLAQANNKPGEKPVFEFSTPLEDKKLGIDVYVGNAGTEHAILFDEPKVKAIDLKTIRRGMMGTPDKRKKFYDHPSIPLDLAKITTDSISGLPTIRKPFENHYNSHYYFQVPFSDKDIKDIQNIDDIKEVKTYGIEKTALEKFLMGSISDQLDDIVKSYAEDNINNIVNMLQADPNTIEKENNSKEIKYNIPFQHPIYKNIVMNLIVKKEHKDNTRSIRVEFPTTVFKSVPALSKLVDKKLWTNKNYSSYAN